MHMLYSYSLLSSASNVVILIAWGFSLQQTLHDIAKQPATESCGALVWVMGKNSKKVEKT